jgi:hypothetical protein
MVVRGNFSTYTIPAAEVTPIPDGVQFTVTVDATDEYRVKKIRMGQLKKEIRARKPELTDAQIEEICARALISGEVTVSRSSNPPRIQGRLSVDENDFVRMYAKIGYEIGALVLGDDWVSSNATAARLRAALVNLDVSAMKVTAAPHNLFPPSPGSHLIVAMRNVRYIRLSEISAFVALDESDGDLSPEKSLFFILDYAAKKHTRMTFHEYVRHVVSSCTQFESAGGQRRSIRV